MNDALIEARGIHTYYGASHILHGVDFRVHRGETVGLMGRNGMGKTTLLKSVLGLVRRPVGKMQGTVSVKGRDMTRAPPHAVALAGIAWFALESTPPRLGFEDTDNPAVMVRFIRAYPEVFVQAGMALILMAISLTVAVLAVAEVIGPRSGAVGLRSTSALGLFALDVFKYLPCPFRRHIVKEVGGLVRRHLLDDVGRPGGLYLV